MAKPDNEARSLKGEMFALSFTALFLEMMVIRWVPSVVHLVAYYANLMLLSSFLGLGAGAMANGRKWKLIGWFPVFLACDIGMLLLDRNTVIGTSASEVHFYSVSPSLLQAFVLIRIFALNALVFVPLGQRMGSIFDALPRLSAYGWDLAGSLSGTLCFGLFSFTMFSPVLGMAGIMVMYLVFAPRRLWLLAVPLFAAVLAAIALSSDPNAIWSPYYNITVNPLGSPKTTVSAPPADLMTMRDPPMYSVNVNQFGYHYDAALEPARYTPGSKGANDALWIKLQYIVPYAISDGRDRILVVGAGGGADVEVGLSQGAHHIDAVEVDPAVIAISKRFNAGGPYLDPRVTVHQDDARSFLAKATPGYDLVVYGYLDSQALFSSMNNVRLDGYVYTVEGIRSAFRLLNANGTLTLSFALGKPWMGPKLYQMVAEATGREPVLYLGNSGLQLILCVPKNAHVLLPPQIERFSRARYATAGHIDLATDDWPFLYLIRKTIPSDYLIAIAGLLALGVAAIAFLRRGSFGRSDLHFGFLGMGFLLLETKSISDCTLFFGGTWVVTMIVVSGVLIMVIAANLVAARCRRFSFAMYLPLFAILALLLFVPRQHILEYGYAGRLLWAVLVVPLPVFFAGIVFSTTFRDAVTPSAAFGANLIGAMVGGFCEYLGMAIGNHRLSLLVVVAYLGSALALGASRRAE